MVKNQSMTETQSFCQAFFFFKTNSDTIIDGKEKEEKRYEETIGIALNRDFGSRNAGWLRFIGQEQNGRQTEDRKNRGISERASRFLERSYHDRLGILDGESSKQRV